MELVLKQVGTNSQSAAPGVKNPDYQLWRPRMNKKSKAIINSNALAAHEILESVTDRFLDRLMDGTDAFVFDQLELCKMLMSGIQAEVMK